MNLGLRDVAPSAELVAASDGRLVTAASDLTTIKGCDAAVQSCLEAFGAVDVLVNCAGAAGIGNVLDLSTADIASAMLLKFHGSLRMAQRVTPLMTDQGWGRIVNVASGAGTSPTADNLPTSLVNITVHNLTRTLSDELAPSGVKVNLVAPGLTLTDRAVTLFAGVAREQGRDPMNLSAKASASLPAGRAALPRRWPAWWRSWHPKYAATCSHLRSTWTVAHAARPLDDLRRRTPCSTTS